MQNMSKSKFDLLEVIRGHQRSNMTSERPNCKNDPSFGFLMPENLYLDTHNAKYVKIKF